VQQVVLVGLAGSPMLDVFDDAGFPIAAEARRPPLRTRRHPALPQTPRRAHSRSAEAAQQALTIVQHGKVVARDGSEVALQADTLCIHSDTPGSTQIAAQVAKALREADVQLRRGEVAFPPCVRARLQSCRRRP